MNAVSVHKITIRRLTLIATLLCVAAPAFATGIFAEPATATASMVWLGLIGLAIAGSPRDGGSGSDSND